MLPTPTTTRWSELRKQRVRVGRAGGVVQAAEAAGVVEAQHPAGVELQLPVVVGQQRRIRRQHAQAPGHAEVDHEAAALELDQEVLRAATDLHHALAGHGPLEAGLHGPAQPALAHARLQHAGALQRGTDAAAGGLDFG
jgi:hypothetical protein